MLQMFYILRDGYSCLEIRFSGRELCIEILAIFNLVVKMGTCSITSGESKVRGVCFASKLSEIDSFFWAIPLLIAVSSPPKSFLPSTSNQGSLRPSTVKQ